jgi:hypothetical protein
LLVILSFGGLLIFSSSDAVSLGSCSWGVLTSISPVIPRAILKIKLGKYFVGDSSSICFLSAAIQPDSR